MSYARKKCTDKDSKDFQNACFKTLDNSNINDYFPRIISPNIIQKTAEKAREPGMINKHHLRPIVTVSAQKAVEKAPKPEMTKKHYLRPIVPVFDYFRSGNSGVTFLRPDEVGPAPVEKTNEKNGQNIVAYSVPYTEAYLNRVPASKVISL